MKIIAVTALFSIVACSKTDEPAASTEPARAEAAAPEPAPEPEPPSLAEQIETRTTAADAGAFATSYMEDKYDEVSLGAVLLARWAAGHLRWSDVHVERDETSPARIKKDADSERGKRMCYSGRIIQIAKNDLGGDRSVYAGLLMARGYNIIHFLAAGSTGDLVERSRARFCGFVTGRYSYSNSGGGSSHAVQMVGMFKLPENLGTN